MNQIHRLWNEGGVGGALLSSLVPSASLCRSGPRSRGCCSGCLTVPRMASGLCGAGTNVDCRATVRIPHCFSHAAIFLSSTVVHPKHRTGWLSRDDGTAA